MKTLSGDQYEELGQIATRTLGESCAIALSRGRHPKGYEHLDPNEDAVGALLDRESWLLAVVDGHRGFEAARAALSAVFEATEPQDRQPAEAVAALFHKAAEAVTEAVVTAETSRRNSRTTLTIALVRGGEMASATLGDSSAVVVSNSGVKPMGRRSDFLGPGVDLSTLAVETTQLSPGDLIILCTDGLTRFLGRRWAARLGKMAREQPDPEPLVRSAVEAAFDGGAGDNIAVAALRV